MDIRIIKSPSQGTIDILMRRKGSLKSEVPPVVVNRLELDIREVI